MPLAQIDIDYASGPQTAADRIAVALRDATIVRISPRDRPTTDPKTFWTLAGESLGRIDRRHEDSRDHKPFEAEWWDIRYDPDNANVYRHSATAQPLHTDNAFHADPPNGALFFCERQARSGGATTFLDGDVLQDVARREDPDLERELRTRPIQFARGDVPGQRTVVIGERTGRPILNWNYYRVVPGQGAEVESLRQRFFEFLRRRFESADELIRVRLAEGEAMVFKEQRLLHGREAFEPDAAHPRLIQTMNLHLPAALD